MPVNFNAISRMLELAEHAMVDHGDEPDGDNFATLREARESLVILRERVEPRITVVCRRDCGWLGWASVAKHAAPLACPKCAEPTLRKLAGPEGY